MRNKFAGNCINCGKFVAAGAGRAWRCLGSSDGHGGGQLHYWCGDGEGAWHVWCAEKCEPDTAGHRREAYEAMSERLNGGSVILSEPYGGDL
jgi:hypothetical protein